MKTHEEKAHQALTQAPGSVRIGAKTYRAKPATLATIIEVGAIASKIPASTLQAPTDTGEGVFTYLLTNARHTATATDIITALIVGATPPDAPYFARKLNAWRRRRVRRYLSTTLTPKTAYDALTELIPLIEIDYFFGLTAFLSQLNLIPANGEAVTTTQHPGA